MEQAYSYKKIWNISYPIIISGIAQNIVNVTDTAFLGRVGPVELGAAGNAGIIYFVLMVIGIGFTLGCQILIGKRNGAKAFDSIGKVLATALVFLIPLATSILFFFHFFSDTFLPYLIDSERILDASRAYLSFRTFGIYFAFINFLFIAFYTGITKTRILIFATLFQSIINVAFDYWLIFGGWGIEALGIKGAAIASVISELGAMLFFIAYSSKAIDYKKYFPGSQSLFSKSEFKQILSTSIPVMLQNFIALGSWLVFFMIIEHIGENELAASHIIRSIYMVMMIPLFGFSSATTSLVSNLIGEGRVNQVLIIVKRIALLSLVCTSAFLPFTLSIPKTLIGIYTSSEVILEMALPLLKVISASMLLFCLAYITFSAVTGTGKTMISLSIETSSIAIYLVFAYIVAIYYQLSLPYVWCSEFIYFSVMAGLSFIYLKFGNWRKMAINE